LTLLKYLGRKRRAPKNAHCALVGRTQNGVLGRTKDEVQFEGLRHVINHRCQMASPAARLISNSVGVS
jgi:hypothetical protein